MKRKLIYIMSPARSGSTLLTYLLTNIPVISSVGELKATEIGVVDEYRCSCGERIIECAFWNELTRRVQAKGRSFSPGLQHTHFTDSAYFSNRVLQATVRGWAFERIRDAIIRFYPRCRRAQQEVLEQNRIVIEEICAMQGSEYFLDDSKTPSRLKYLYQSGFWDVYVISLRRDGRGVVNSAMKTGYSVVRATSEWLHITREIEAVTRELATAKIYEVSYEEVCSDPRRELGKICEFLNIDATDSLQGQLLDKTGKHIIGNQMRLRNIDEVRLDESWRSTLTADQLAYFDSNAGAVNRSLGYTN